MTPAETIIGRLNDRGCNPRQSRPGQWTARCPNTHAHRNGDRHPSLSIGDAPDGKALIHCATGCPPAAIVEALDLTVLDLFPDRTDQKPAERRITARYPYTNADGELLFEAIRYEPKGFAQRRPAPDGHWIWSISNLTERPIYRLPAILQAIRNGNTIWIAEGEKDVEALVAAGHQATCNPMGAGKWKPEHTAALTGAKLVEIVADDDPAGHHHAQQIHHALTAAGIHNRTWLPHRGCRDIAEHLGQGRHLQDLRPLDPDPDPEPEQEPDPTDLRSILIDWTEFWTEDHTSETWLAWPLIPAHRQIALYAPPKTGKSLLTIAVVAAVATGQPILGQPAQPPQHVLYLDYEMTKADLHERLDSLGYGPHSDLTHLHYASLPTLPPLNTPAGGQAVLALALAVEATLVIVDTTGRAVDGDENDSGPYRDFARHTGLPLKQHDIGLLRTDHAGKDKTKGQRGSSAKNDDVDVVFRLDLADNGYTLQRTHSRVGWVPERVAIERIQDPDGQIRFNTNRAQLWPVGTVETAAQLDLLRCPADATTREASAILRDSGIGRRAAVVGAALRYRRESGLAGDPVEF